MSFTVLITAADGRTYRCGPDEPDAGWAPENITFGTALPGGDKEGTFNLRRRSTEDVPLRLLDEVEFIDTDGTTVYAGRIQQLPRQTGDDFLLGVNCLGWAAHLLDDTSFSQVYVDRVIGNWQEPNLARLTALATASTPMGKIPMSIGQSEGITWNPPNEALPTAETSEAWYDIGSGHTVFYFSYRGQRIKSFTGFEAPALYGGPSLDTTSGSTALTLDDTPRLVDLTAAPARALMVRCTTSGAVTPPAGALQVLEEAVVYGDHWLAGQGMADGHYGYFIDDLLSHALSVAAPKLNFTTGPGGSIERPPVLVAQAAYRDPTSVDAVILDWNKLVLWDWLVYGKTFYYRPTDPDRLTWEARLDQGIHLSLEGDDAEHAYNGAMVKYTTPDGTAKVAGPTGSGFDVESDLLADLSADNSVNVHGYPRKWIELDIQFPIMDLYATTIGAAYLAQASLPSRSGSIELQGQIRHPTRGLRPVHEVRSGDWLKLSDHPSDVPRRIVATSYDHDSLKTTVTVGNDVDKISSLLEQLGVLTTIKLG